MGSTYSMSKVSATARSVTCPAHTLRPFSRLGSAFSAASVPLSARARANGSVALERAWVEVRETAPGMLDTQ